MLRRLIPAILFVIIVGCGGGGGGNSTGGTCSVDSYVPNYATAPGMTLRKWDHLPIKVFFTSSTPIGSTTIEQHVREGFDKWETALSRDLWTEVGSAGAADLVVTVQAHAPQTTLATTTVFFASGSSIITSATMTVFTWPAIAEADYDPTGCHEMGHALGIGGHSSINTDIMYFTGNLSGLLTTPDVNTLRTCYCDFGSIAQSAKSAPVDSSKLDSETFVFPVK